MHRFKEGEINSSFRLTNPNHASYLESLPRIERIMRPEKIEIFDVNVQGHEKRTRIRTLPRLGRLLRVANGVNSRSAIVFRSVFDIAKSA